jgi:hypothetical protein
MRSISGLNRGLPQLGVGKSSKHRKPLRNLLQGLFQLVYQPYLRVTLFFSVVCPDQGFFVLIRIQTHVFDEITVKRT